MSLRCWKIGDEHTWPCSVRLCNSIRSFLNNAFNTSGDGFKRERSATLKTFLSTRLRQETGFETPPETQKNNNQIGIQGILDDQGDPVFDQFKENKTICACLGKKFQTREPNAKLSEDFCSEHSTKFPKTDRTLPFQDFADMTKRKK